MVISSGIEGILKRLVLLPADLNKTKLIFHKLVKKINNRRKIERILFKAFNPKSRSIILKLFLTENDMTKKLIDVEEELRKTMKKRDEKSIKKIISTYGLETDFGSGEEDEQDGQDGQDEQYEQDEKYQEEVDHEYPPRWTRGGCNNKPKRKQKKTMKKSKTKTRKFSKKRLTKRNKRTKKKSNKRHINKYI